VARVNIIVYCGVMGLAGRNFQTPSNNCCSRQPHRDEKPCLDVYR
jgi:hypothetical protein